MKLALFDYTNFGLVYINVDPFAGRWQLDILRNCILDTNITRVFPNNPFYQEITNDSIQENFYFLSSNGVRKGNSQEINEYYIEKQRLAMLMAPVIRRLCTAVFDRSLNSLSEFGTSMDSALYSALAESIPEKEIWSPGIIEYAGTLDITPFEAYNEIKLDYKTTQFYKIKSYATVKKYQLKIRNIKTQTDADNILEEINQKLIKDTWI